MNVKKKKLSLCNFNICILVNDLGGVNIRIFSARVESSYNKYSMRFCFACLRYESCLYENLFFAFVVFLAHENDSARFIRFFQSVRKT